MPGNGVTVCSVPGLQDDARRSGSYPRWALPVAATAGRAGHGPNEVRCPFFEHREALPANVRAGRLRRPATWRSSGAGSSASAIVGMRVTFIAALAR